MSQKWFSELRSGSMADKGLSLWCSVIAGRNSGRQRKSAISGQLWTTVIGNEAKNGMAG